VFCMFFLTSGHFCLFLCLVVCVFCVFSLLCCEFGGKLIAWVTHLRNDLLCVERDVKHYSVTLD